MDQIGNKKSRGISTQNISEEPRGKTIAHRILTVVQHKIKNIQVFDTLIIIIMNMKISEIN